MHTYSVWDTAGQEQFEDIRVLAYDNVDILLVSFSIVNHASYENVKSYWYPEIQKQRKKFKKGQVS